MRRRLTILMAAAILGLAPAAPASARAWVRGPVAQAGMIATVIGEGSDPIQVLSRRCARVREETGCVRIPRRLRSAVEDAVAAPITWVHRSLAQRRRLLGAGAVRLARRHRAVPLHVA